MLRPVPLYVFAVVVAEVVVVPGAAAGRQPSARAVAQAGERLLHGPATTLL
ncbi:MAG: hypothetical protein G3I10_10375 [Ferrovum sp.]|nr:hypothetical protein [Ferrovum sp.]